MAPFFFKLGDPTVTQRTAGVAETPLWLEEHFSRVNSENEEAVLGQVNTSLIKAEPATSCPSTFYNTGNDAHPCSYVQHRTARPLLTARPQTNQRFWENTEEGFSNEFSFSTKSTPVKKAVNPKQFCDDIYMRLMNVFFVITDEKEAAKTQTEVTQVVNEIESGFIKK